MLGLRCGLWGWWVARCRVRTVYYIPISVDMSEGKVMKIRCNWILIFGLYINRNLCHQKLVSQTSNNTSCDRILNEYIIFYVEGNSSFLLRFADSPLQLISLPLSRLNRSHPKHPHSMRFNIRKNRATRLDCAR